MPELPEVEVSRQIIESALKGKKIKKVWVDKKHPNFFVGVTPTQFEKALQGATVFSSGRKGKYFWLKLNNRLYAVFHFGMSGNLEVLQPNKDYAKSWGGIGRWHKSKNWKTRFEQAHCRLRFWAADGTEVVFTDPRRFGKMRLSKNPLNEPPILLLGFDPLFPFPSAKELQKILVTKRAPIKAVLLDQSIFAGVGNWVADETLFQARIAPQRKAESLSLAEVAKLRNKLLAIVKKAVAVQADYERYPKSWLFHLRWRNRQGHKNDAQVKFVKIGGRTSAWVPSRQK